MLIPLHLLNQHGPAMSLVICAAIMRLFPLPIWGRLESLSIRKNSATRFKKGWLCIGSGLCGLWPIYIHHRI